jgi:hypothetical protein
MGTVAVESGGAASKTEPPEVNDRCVIVFAEDIVVLTITDKPNHYDYDVR